MSYNHIHVIVLYAHNISVYKNSVMSNLNTYSKHMNKTIRCHSVTANKHLHPLQLTSVTQ